MKQLTKVEIEEWLNHPCTSEILERIVNRIEELKEEAVQLVMRNPTGAQRIAWIIQGYRDVLEFAKNGDEAVTENINPRELQ